MSVRITSVTRREETIVRHGGNGDNFHMTWAADDRQYLAVCDGMGWFDPPKAYYNSRLWAIEGGPQEATFHDIPAYPDLAVGSGSTPLPGYYNFGTLALDGHIYQFLSTTGDADHPVLFVGVKLIYSPDNGQTWHNADGSTPVVWEPYERRSRETMVFFKEGAQNAFSVLTVLQMGRNYEHNRDGYIYAYAPNGCTDETGNQLVMFRVRKTDISDRRAYEFFAGHRAHGGADWTNEIDARAVVHTFPRGYVSEAHAHTWVPSVAYNAGLGLYMMANFGMAWCGPNGEFGADPSYLGFWVAQQPWGPWTQVHEETAWLPAGDPKARAYEAQIAPKWIAEDGRSFWLVWTDFQGNDVYGTESSESGRSGPADIVQVGLTQRERQPYYSFNVQRVDITVA